MKQTEILTHATHVNGWEPAVYMSCMSQNFRLFHVSNLSVRNFRIFLLMYPALSYTAPLSPSETRPDCQSRIPSVKAHPHAAAPVRYRLSQSHVIVAECYPTRCCSFPGYPRITTFSIRSIFCTLPKKNLPRGEEIRHREGVLHLIYFILRL